MIGRHVRDRAAGRIDLRDLQVGEFGNVLGHRIVQLPLALLEQDHHGDAGDRLAHGINAEDAVLLHRRAAFQLTLAGRLQLHDLAFSRHHGHDARHVATLGDCFHFGREQLEPLRRHADGFGTRGT